MPRGSPSAVTTRISLRLISSFRRAWLSFAFAAIGKHLLHNKNGVEAKPRHTEDPLTAWSGTPIDRRKLSGAGWKPGGFASLTLVLYHTFLGLSRAFQKFFENIFGDFPGDFRDFLGHSPYEQNGFPLPRPAGSGRDREGIQVRDSGARGRSAPARTWRGRPRRPRPGGCGARGSPASGAPPSDTRRGWRRRSGREDRLPSRHPQ